VRNAEGLKPIYRGNGYIGNNYTKCNKKTSKIKVEQLTTVQKTFENVFYVVLTTGQKTLMCFGLYNLNSYPLFSDYIIRIFSILGKNERNYVPYEG